VSSRASRKRPRCSRGARLADVAGGETGPTPRGRAANRHQRQRGHTNWVITWTYRHRSTEITDTVHARRAPMVPVDTSARL
jgi:hypothetical protein